MSHSIAPSNGLVTQYPTCESWCYYGRDCDIDEHESYCLRPVGPEVMARTDDDVLYEIFGSQAYQRLPFAAPIEDQARANRHHRDVVHLALLSHAPGLPELRLDLNPSAARTLAAVLVRLADLTERLAW